MTFEEKAEIVISQLRADRDRLQNIIEQIKAEIDRQEKWLLQAGYTAYNVDIAFDAIKAVLAESEVKNDRSTENIILHSRKYENG
jgi:hypothetical protein